MILDSLGVISDNQDLHSGSCPSTHSIDTGSRTNYDDGWNSHPGAANIANGRPIRAQILINNVTVGSGAPTIKCALQQSSDNSSFSDLVDSGVYALATGQDVQFDLLLPQGGNQQYLQAYFTIGGSGSFTSINATVGFYVGGGQTNHVW
jgi:hypothetical protein